MCPKGIVVLFFLSRVRFVFCLSVRSYVREIETKPRFFNKFGESVPERNQREPNLVDSFPLAIPSYTRANSIPCTFFFFFLKRTVKSDLQY